MSEMLSEVCLRRGTLPFFSKEQNIDNNNKVRGELRHQTFLAEVDDALYLCVCTFVLVIDCISLIVIDCILLVIDCISLIIDCISFMHARTHKHTQIMGLINHSFGS
jgi:hypothetical protein